MYVSIINSIYYVLAKHDDKNLRNFGFMYKHKQNSFFFNVQIKILLFKFQKINFKITFSI